MKISKSIGLLAAIMMTWGATSVAVAQNSPPPAGTNTGAAQEPGKADQPKQYQPVNPAPDPRAAPTGSSSGVGSSSGGRPEQEPAKK